MSCCARNAAVGTGPSGVRTTVRVGSLRDAVHVPDHDRGDRGGDRRDVAHRQHRDVVHAECLQAGDRPARRVAEPDDHGAQRPAVVPGRPGQRHGVQHRAVAGHLVVHVEDVDHEVPRRRPVVHGLPGDQGQALVDGDLGEVRVLDRVRPSPQHLPVVQRVEVVQRRLGEQDDVGARDDLVAGQPGRPPGSPGARRRRRSAGRSRAPGPCGPAGRGRSARCAAGGWAAGTRSPCWTSTAPRA